MADYGPATLSTLQLVFDGELSGGLSQELRWEVRGMLNADSHEIVHQSLVLHNAEGGPPRKKTVYFVAWKGGHTKSESEIKSFLPMRLRTDKLEHVKTSRFRLDEW